MESAARETLALARHLRVTHGVIGLARPGLDLAARDAGTVHVARRPASPIRCVPHQPPADDNVQAGSRTTLRDHLPTAGYAMNDAALDAHSITERAPLSEPARVSDVSALLKQRAETARRDATILAGRTERASLARLAVAALIVLAAAGAFGEPRHRAAFVIALVVITAGFAALVRRSRRLDDLKARALGRAVVSEQGVARAERSWARIDPQPWSWPRDDGEHQRIDLDVVGPDSLIQLLPTISAAVGAPRMREWLSTLASADILRERQAGVRELTDAVELREAFELAARRLRLTEARIAWFIEWGRAPGQTEPTWPRVASRALPALTVASIAATTVWPPAASLAMLSVLATVMLALFVRAQTGDAVRAADVGAHISEAYSELAGVVRHASFASPLLRKLQAKLDLGPAGHAEDALHRLQRLAAWSEVRSSPMMHAALQALFAWDFQLARAVDDWRRSYGSSLDEWFSALAEIECLAALAGLAYTNPDWAFPDLSPGQPLRLRARRLGHPLLPAGARVSNDVEIGPPGTVLLISGSNMSGKSTLLRAIGLNALLARVGGPVCAEAMWCPPMRLFTSLRVQDSLAEGISYFMAEALRLRDIVFAAESDAGAGAPPLLYLVDEILRGTNSEERAVASRLIIARLLRTSAIGTITTHDLGVFSVPEIAEHARHAHFAERFTGDGERLTFDYTLRPGPTTSSNAMRLLSLIGLTQA